TDDRDHGDGTLYVTESEEERQARCIRAQAVCYVGVILSVGNGKSKQHCLLARQSLIQAKL
ncbi:hypothetical protein, partial [Chitiniphilus shinanonensis]|uniref:hypothetical protein n=1 Tax=Chitiniphilus shinanonensis TaxID=553088 RepID=UPI0024E06D25